MESGPPSMEAELMSTEGRAYDWPEPVPPARWGLWAGWGLLRDFDVNRTTAIVLPEPGYCMHQCARGPGLGLAGP